MWTVEPRMMTRFAECPGEPPAIGETYLPTAPLVSIETREHADLDGRSEAVDPAAAEPSAFSA